MHGGAGLELQVMIVAVDGTRDGRSGCKQCSHQAQTSRRIFVLDTANSVFPAPAPTRGVGVGAVWQLRLSTVDSLPISRLPRNFHVAAAVLDSNRFSWSRCPNRAVHLSNLFVLDGHFHSPPRKYMWLCCSARKCSCITYRRNIKGRYLVVCMILILYGYIRYLRYM
ncbi:hypothetical protein F4801DRAFT_570173, partial [Xylaria longipes]